MPVTGSPPAGLVEGAPVVDGGWDGGTDADADGGTDTDADGDTDAEGDTDGDTEGDADGDGDGEAGAHCSQKTLNFVPPGTPSDSIVSLTWNPCCG